VLGSPHVSVIIMTPYLVCTRNGAGETVMFAAVFATKQEALEAVKKVVPPNWRVEAVTGEAPPDLAKREKLEPGKVVQLAGPLHGQV
jgi:hypothetical protein